MAAHSERSGSQEATLRSSPPWGGWAPRGWRRLEVGRNQSVKILKKNRFLLDISQYLEYRESVSQTLRVYNFITFHLSSSLIRQTSTRLNDRASMINKRCISSVWQHGADTYSDTRVCFDSEIRYKRMFLWLTELSRNIWLLQVIPEHGSCFLRETWTRCNISRFSSRCFWILSAKLQPHGSSRFILRCLKSNLCYLLPREYQLIPNQRLTSVTNELSSGLRVTFTPLIRVIKNVCTLSCLRERSQLDY